MRAYYFDNAPGDQRLPHDSGNPVSGETLTSINALHWSIPVDDAGKWKQQIDEVAHERGYKNRDIINVSKEGLGDLFESKLKGFFQEHMHEDDEIRYVLSGDGYFDVRGTRIICFTRPGNIFTHRMSIRAYDRRLDSGPFDLR